MVTFPAEGLKRVVATIIQKTGSAPEEADIVASHLVEANLKGHDSHGVGMVPRYIKNFHEGLVKPNTSATCVTDAGAILQFEAGKGFGQRVAREAMAAACARAAETGVVLMTLRNAYHVGRVGAYGEQAVEEGFASITFVNVGDHTPSVAPFGGGDARLITNPMCVCVPGTDATPPVILDMATSRVALGKVRVAYNKGLRMDDGILIDERGRPTDDPGVMFPELRGAIRAFGEHKGYGLSLMAELLGGVLSGGQTVQPAHERLDGIVNNMFSVVFDPQRLVDRDWFAREIDATIAYVKDSPPADPAKPVMVAGDPERKSMEARLRSGIPVDDTTWEEILAAGESLGLGRDDTATLAA